MTPGGAIRRASTCFYILHQYFTQPMIYAVYDCTFMSISYNKFVAMKRLILRTRRSCKLSVCELLRKYKLQNFRIKQILSLDSFRGVTLRNDKNYINFKIFKIFCLSRHNFASQTRINPYTLILEKNFRICEKEKSICYTKIID